MSTTSTLLLCAGAASSLAAVWTLAGFSETSTPRFTPRVFGAAAVGLGAQLAVYGRVPSLRGDLSLAMLFGLASVAALVVGAAKVEGALREKDGARVVRRSAGIVAGSFFGMAAVGAAALDLSSSSLAHARSAWMLMFGLVLATLVVFAQRARYAGVALLALGARVAVLGLVCAALLLGARLTVAAPVHAEALPAPVAVPAASEAAPAAIASEAAPVANVPAPVPSAAAAAPSVAVPTPAPSEPAPVVSAAPLVSAAPVGKPGELQIEAVTTRGLYEADVRGGISRRMDRLQACLADAKNNQSGALTLKVGIDASGSVTYSRATGGDLIGTPLATCLLPVFYKMGFAAPASNNAGFEITLRAPPQ
jgi:hypothetical protein